MTRHAMFLVFATACGASSKTTPVVDLSQSAPTDASGASATPDAGREADDSWNGQGCKTIASRNAEVAIPKLTVTGRLYEGRTHCYLDLEQPLCLQYPPAGDSGAGTATNDAGLEHLDVWSLRIDGGCSRSGEAIFRGKLSGAIEPIMHQRGSVRGWTVSAEPTKLESVTREVSIAETADKPTTLSDLKDRFMVCWVTAIKGSALMAGRITLDLQVGAAGEVTDVKRTGGAGMSTEVETCVIDAARSGAKFEPGAVRHVTLPVTFSRSLTPAQ